MNKITLRQAVEMLHKDGDPVDVAVLRIRRALAAEQISSFGLAVGKEYSGEWFEVVDRLINPWHWEKAVRIDWQQSAIEMPKEYDENNDAWMYYSRIVLDRASFDRVFFPDKVKQVAEQTAEQKPPIAIREIRTWLNREYDGKPRPGVHDLRAAAKAHDPRITRTLLEFAAAEKWPEPRRRGRPVETK